MYQIFFDIFISIICFCVAYSLYRFYAGKTVLPKAEEDKRIEKVKKYGGVYVITIIGLILLALVNIIISFQ